MKSFIYVAHLVGFNLYKIGVTQRDCSGRIKQLNHCSPFEVVLVSSTPTHDGYNVEFLLHRELKEKHVRGEWFRLTDADLRKLQFRIAHVTSLLEPGLKLKDVCFNIGLTRECLGDFCARVGMLDRFFGIPAPAEKVKP